MGRQPIDNGWAWVVCLGCGVQAFFVIGGLKSMGILFVEIIEIFAVSRTVTSLTLGLTAGGFAVFAILSNPLSVIFGMRLLCVCGAVTFILSIFLAMFPVNIWYTIIVLGLLSGLAFGAMLTPAILVLSMYFDKRKSFGNGLALAGGSVGQIVMPYIITFLLDHYGFSGAMLIYTGIAMHALPAAMLLRPVGFWDRRHKWKLNSADKEGHDSLSPTPALRDLADTESGAREDDRHLGQADTQTSVKEGHRYLGPADTQAGVKEGHKLGRIRIRPMGAGRFCKLIFDRELMMSPCMWLLFFSLGLGHAGFIDVLLHLPALAVELFNDKKKGAMFVTIVGLFDLCGRVVGGWFSDLGYMTRTSIITMGFTVSGVSTVIMAAYPSMAVLITYCVVMGVFGGLYRILLPVIVGDLFGRAKLGTGVGMLFMSLGLIIVPVPTILGYMKESLGSYRPAVHLCGALLLFGALLLVVLRLIQKYDKAVVKEPAANKQLQDGKHPVENELTNV